MYIHLTFAYPISQVYREKLQTLSDNFVAQAIAENGKPPLIHFPGMNRETYSESCRLVLRKNNNVSS